jgi:hypothetical protein
MQQDMTRKMPLWGWLPFLPLDGAVKYLAMIAIGYSHGVATVSSVLSAICASIVGVIFSAASKRVGPVSFGIVYFVAIVAAKIALVWMSGGSEWLGDELLVDGGVWKWAGARWKLLVAVVEASLSAVVLGLLQMALAYAMPRRG